MHIRPVSTVKVAKAEEAYFGQKVNTKIKDTLGTITAVQDFLNPKTTSK